MKNRNYVALETSLPFGAWPKYWILTINNYTENVFNEAEAIALYNKAVKHFGL